MSLFYELFGEHKQKLSAFDRALNNAEVKSVSVDKNDNSLVMVVGFPILLKEETLDNLSKQLSSLLGVEGVYIEPVFPSKLLSNKYDRELTEVIRRRLVVANGFLDGCEYQYDEGFNNLTVVLAGAGKNILSGNICESVIKEIIRSRFGVDLNVTIEQKVQSEAPSLEEMQQQIDMQIQKKAEESHKDKPVSATVIEEGYPYYTDSVRVIYGNKIKSKPTPMSQIMPDDDRVVVWGKIFAVDSRLTKNGEKYIIDFNVTDFTDSFTCTVFERKEYCEVLINKLEKGAFVVIAGTRTFDKYKGEVVINPKSICLVTPVEKEDDEPEKRVELHLHTNMSQLDAMTPPAELVKRAIKWGHKAIAITDHGCVQGFPEARVAAGDKIKIIYGIEGYFVDDITEPDVAIKDKPTYHQIILVKNSVGLKNLYKLVSMSNVTYFYKRPRMPKSEIIKHREGLIIGSACEAGELYRAILEEKSEEEITKIASFYDYLEIQPVGNNKFMLEAHSDPNSKNPERNARYDKIHTVEDIENINRKVIAIAAEDKNIEQVYRLNLQLFPLTKSIKENNNEKA